MIISISASASLPQPCYASVITSPLGQLWIRHNQQLLYQLQYNLEAACDLSLALTDLPYLWQDALQRYFLGEFDQLKCLPIALDQGTPFQQQVWLALPNIPAGTTFVTYNLPSKLIDPRQYAPLDKP